MSAYASVNILIVDDKPEKVLALEALLEDSGHRIVRAYSGREALRCLLREEFAVILLDVNMPGMDGFETAALIRQRPATQHVPIIFVTAFGDEAHCARGYSLGAVDYIQTPVVPDVLRTKVMVFVDLFRKTEQVRRQAESLRRRAAQMQKLAAAAVAISGALSLEPMLQTVTNTARDVLSAQQAIMLFMDPAAAQPQVRVIASFSNKYAEWRGRPLTLDSLEQTAAFRSFSVTRLTEADLLDHPDLEMLQRAGAPAVRGGLLAAPLTGRDGTRFGIIYVRERIDGDFNTDDEAVAIQLAQMSSIAIDNALYSQEREANRIKDEFLSTLSHELRTPLNAILGWTQLLRLQSTSDEVRHGLEVIERNARAQAKLVEDLLDVSRITSGKLRLNCQPLRLSAVVDAAIEVIRPLIDEKRLTLTWRGPACDDSSVGDFDRLQQVVWNLLSNAAKFTPDGGRIEIRLESIHGQLRLQVIDTGKGIDPVFLPHVFDRFRQADSSSTRTQGGLGIGLTIVRHIVELHGGTVQAHSAGEGCGATFTMILPPADAAPVGAAADGRWGASPLRAMSQQRDAVNLSGVRALIVDDEQDARDIIAHALRRAGATVLACPSVQHAIDAIAEQIPDVIISDIAMPGEDGYHLIRTIRHSPQTQHLPAIAMTAYAREEDHRRSLLEGFQRHLAKPVDPIDLVAVVADLLELRVRHAPLAERPDAAPTRKPIPDPTVSASSDPAPARNADSAD